MPRALRRTDLYVIQAVIAIVVAIAIVAALKYFGLLHEAIAGGHVARLGW